MLPTWKKLAINSKMAKKSKWKTSSVACSKRCHCQVLHSALCVRNIDRSESFERGLFLQNHFFTGRPGKMENNIEKYLKLYTYN